MGDRTIISEERVFCVKGTTTGRQSIDLATFGGRGISRSEACLLLFNLTNCRTILRRPRRARVACSVSRLTISLPAARCGREGAHLGSGLTKARAVVFRGIPKLSRPGRLAIGIVVGSIVINTRNTYTCLKLAESRRALKVGSRRLIGRSRGKVVVNSLKKSSISFIKVGGGGPITSMRNRPFKVGRFLSRVVREIDGGRVCQFSSHTRLRRGLTRKPSK